MSASRVDEILSMEELDENTPAPDDPNVALQFTDYTAAWADQVG